MDSESSLRQEIHLFPRTHTVPIFSFCDFSKGVHMFTVASENAFVPLSVQQPLRKLQLKKIRLINVDPSQVEENSQRPPISMRGLPVVQRERKHFA